MGIEKNVPKIGRPKKNPDEKMSKTVQIYMTEHEYNDVLQSVGETGDENTSGKSISESLKEVLLGWVRKNRS